MAKNRDHFNCSTCKERYCDSSNPAPYKLYEIPGVIDTDTCLLPMVSQLSTQMLELYGHYKNRLLPFAGGILDQPQAFQTAMNIIDNYLQKEEK